jgi:hypothetical protein
MCSGPQCPGEALAWQLYDEHGYRPRELRPCLTTPRSLTADYRRPRRLRPVLRPFRRTRTGPAPR